MTLEADFTAHHGAFELRLAMSISDGEVVALLGPNGSGKSTALHTMAGLVPVTTGQIHLSGQCLDDPAANVFVAPENRPVSLVFQDYLLFPHMDARNNIAFAVRAGGVKNQTALAEADRWLERFDLDAVSHHKPSQLSGGQAQRVALARALATKPALLLLDEPLAALDAATRITVRRELRKLLSGFDGATILVTHDPLDALALASRIIILEAGRVSQDGEIADLTARPRSPFVAELVGLNLFTGTAVGNKVTIDGSGHPLTITEPIDGDVFAAIHPRAVAIHLDEPEGSPRNRWHNQIESFELLGDRVRVRTTGDPGLVAEITTASMAELGLHEGDQVWLTVKATEVTIYRR